MQSHRQGWVLGFCQRAQQENTLFVHSLSATSCLLHVRGHQYLAGKVTGNNSAV